MRESGGDPTCGGPHADPVICISFLWLLMTGEANEPVQTNIDRSEVPWLSACFYGKAAGKLTRLAEIHSTFALAKSAHH